MPKETASLIFGFAALGFLMGATLGWLAYALGVGHDAGWLPFVLTCGGVGAVSAVVSAWRHL